MIGKNKIYTNSAIERRFSALRTLIAVAIALAIAFILILTVSNAPGKDMVTFLIGPLTSPKRIATMVEKVIPLLFTGTAVCLINACGQINIAVEGAFFGGTVASTVVAIMPGIPMGIHYVLCLLAGALAGAVICGIPALLHEKFHIMTIVSSLMMNYIILYLGLYIILNLVRDPSAGFEASYKFEDTAKLDSLIPGTNIHIGLILGILVVFLGAWLLQRSTFGFSVRTLGFNSNFARYSGIAVGTVAILAQCISGAVCGMGGGAEVLGLYSRFSYTNLTQHGFDGIMISVLAKNDPAKVPLAALFLAYIRTASDVLNRSSNMPTEVVKVVQAVVIMFIAAESFLSGWEHKAIVENSRKLTAQEKEG